MTRRELSDLWHLPSEEPDRSREPILRLHRDNSAGTIHYSLLRSEEEVQIMMSGIVAWAYLDDLLPGFVCVLEDPSQNTRQSVWRKDEIEEVRQILQLENARIGNSKK